MKTLRTITKLAGWRILAAWALLLPAPALATAQAPDVARLSLTVKRAGRLLTLDCQRLGANGQRAPNPDRDHPPKFAVYQGDRQIGSGTFEYG